MQKTKNTPGPNKVNLSSVWYSTEFLPRISRQKRFISANVLSPAEFIQTHIGDRSTDSNYCELMLNKNVQFGSGKENKEKENSLKIPKLLPRQV